MENDSIRLLRECNAGIKMGVASIGNVLDKVQSAELREILECSKEAHARLGDTSHTYLQELGDDGKEPAAMAKLMSKVKTTVMLDEDGPDSTIADLILEGCNMGVKSLYRYLNKYKAAEEKIRRLALAVAEEEEGLAKDMRRFL